MAVAVLARPPVPSAGVPDGIRRYETVNLSAAVANAARQRGSTEIAFQVLGRAFDLELEPNDVYAQGATIVWVDDAGRVEEAPNGSGELYRGRVAGESGSWVRLQIRAGGELTGVVATADDIYFLEPADRFLGGTAAGQTLAYRLSDIDPNWEFGSCAAREHERRSRRERIEERREGASAMRAMLAEAVGGIGGVAVVERAEIGAVADFQYFSAHGANSAADIAQVVNLVDGIYQAELGVTVQILTTVVYTTSSDPFTETTDPNTILNEFSAYHDDNDNSAGQLLYGADLAHLFTGRNLDSTVIGIAWLNTLCSSHYGSAVSQIDFSSSLYEKTLLAAHEMGHNFGAPHDNQSGSQCGSEPGIYIMNPVLGSSLQQQFSPCSKSLIGPAVTAATCLDQVTPAPTPTPTNTVPATATRTPTTAPYGAAFVAQSVPTSMTAGQTYTVSVRMRNTGANTWTAAANYRLGSTNPNNNTTWGLSRVLLGSTESIALGQEKLFTFTVRAPSTAGTYNFQWRMLREGVLWFGSATPNVAVTVTAGSSTRNAAFVTQSVPAVMTAGQQYAVSVTMQNTGTATWTAGTNYRLGSTNPNNNTTWGLSRVYLGASDSIAPGQSKTFTFTVKAPTTVGTYNFQWRMLQEGVAWFGTASTNVAVTVGSTPAMAAEFASQSVPATMTAGQQYTVSVTMKNMGTNTWTAAENYRLGSTNPNNNTTWGRSRVYLDAGDSIAPGQSKTFTFTVTAPATPGTYAFQWRMLRELVAWFGEATALVQVTVQ